ncbi:MAG: hypothetical protein HZA84_06135 [Thaumarchaeota archaeon]|nr:hypothetical protein [Nitrososphaerota archaeon]
MEVDIATLVSVFLALIGGIVTAVVFLVKLSERVKHLEGNPLLLAFKQIEQNSAIDMFSDYIKKTLEKKNG